MLRAIRARLLSARRSRRRSSVQDRSDRTGVSPCDPDHSERRSAPRESSMNSAACRARAACTGCRAVVLRVAARLSISSTTITVRVPVESIEDLAGFASSTARRAGEDQPASANSSDKCSRAEQLRQRRRRGLADPGSPSSRIARFERIVHDRHRRAVRMSSSAPLVRSRRSARRCRQRDA